MDFEKVKEYFEDVVKNFPPFKNSRVFQSLVSYLSNYYLEDHYENIPSELKEVYEENNIIDSVLDQFLLSLGVYQDVVDNLNANEKRIFVNSLSDFFRYKSTIDFFQKVANFFPDRVDVYELFIDYDSSDSKWILKPYEIYRNELSEGFNRYLDYAEVYESVPSLLVSPSQLDSYRENDNVVLPLKSNLILLSYSFISELNELTNLSISTFLKEYGNETVSIYFNDDSYNISINNIMQVWYYLIWSLDSNSKPWSGDSVNRLLLYATDLNPYTLEDIENISEELNSLEYSSDIYEYFDEYIQKPFLTTHLSQDFDYDKFKDILSVSESELMDYLDNRLDGLSGDDFSSEINEILLEIYNSLILHKTTNDSELKNKYFEIFISSLPQVILKVDETSSYQIFHNFKPYHSELVTQSFSSIRSESQLDKILPKDTDYDFLLKLIKADYSSMLSEYISHVINFSEYEPSAVFSFYRIKNSWEYTDKEDIRDRLYSKSQKIKIQILQLSEFCNSTISVNTFNFLERIEKIIFNILSSKLEEYKLEDFLNGNISKISYDNN
ncbi:MAG: hypothetical protein ACOC22_01985, partial [bacterium]